MSAPIYLDHHATTPVDPRVLEAMLPYFSEDFGNPASHGHVYGWRAAAAVDLAREEIASLLGAERPEEIVFTSGATESNNLALFGVARSRPGSHVVSVATEHLSILDPLGVLGAEGHPVTQLEVGASGLLDLDRLADALGPDTTLVSVMAANNEIGVLQPIGEIAAICRERGVAFHSDAAQATGKIPLDVGALGIDLLSLSGHKMYGPKGIGALYVRSGRIRRRMTPLLYGGGHEGGLRPGTLATPLIVGLARAFALSESAREEETRRIGSLRDRLLSRLRTACPGLEVNGDLEHRLPDNLHVSFHDIDANQLVADLPNVAISTGAACSSATPEPSHVLRALGHDADRVRSGVRFGLGHSTTEEQIDRAATAVADAVNSQRAAKSAVSTRSLVSHARSSDPPKS